MIGINGKPYISYDDFLDTKYLKRNELSIHKAISNCDVDSWSVTGGNLNIFPIDKKHQTLLNHKGVEYNLSDIKNKQLFEQLHFKIYNVGYYKLLKGNYSYTDSFEYFSFMETFLDSLPFKNIKKILLMVLPAGCETVIHRDPLRDRFIYLRPDESKKFFVYDENNNVKHYVHSLSSEWAFEDYHGADAKPYANYAFKIAGDLAL